MLTTGRGPRGFTLVELIIVLAIMGVLLAAAAPNVSTFIQNSRIRNAAESIQNGMALARAEAVRRNANVQFALATDTSWTVRCETAAADGDGDGIPDCPGSSPSATTPDSIQARPASDGSRNTAVDVSATLTFDPLGRIASGISAGSSATLTVGSCDASSPVHCLKVIATPGGQVRMCNPLLSSPDPQAC